MQGLCAWLHTGHGQWRIPKSSPASSNTAQHLVRPASAITEGTAWCTAYESCADPCDHSLISDYFFPKAGGVESHIYCVAQSLLKRNHRVRYFAPRESFKHS